MIIKLFDKLSTQIDIYLRGFMNIKEAIGNRITTARKALGITIKELAARTSSLSAARISNWEQGTRSPGPVEAKIVANVLNVSPSYLLCLTDNPEGEISHPSGNTPRVISVVSMQNALHTKEAENQIILSEEKKSITLDSFNQSSNSYLFAVLVDDSSMQPDLNQNDLVIIDSQSKPCPGDFVLAFLVEKKQTVLRRYRETETCLFQLLATNPLWATTNVKYIDDVKIIGKVTEIRRYL